MIQTARGDGQKLHVHIEWDDVPSKPNMPGPLITPAFVRKAIEFGQNGGWTPHARGRNFTLRYSQGGFV